MAFVIPLCKGSHMQCQDQACLCGCHGRRPSPLATRRGVDIPAQDVERLLAEGLTQTQVAERYAVSTRTIRRICKTHNIGPTRPTLDKDEIKRLHDSGVSISELARRFSVDRRTVYQACGLGAMRTTSPAPRISELAQWRELGRKIRDGQLCLSYEEQREQVEQEVLRLLGDSR